MVPPPQGVVNPSPLADPYSRAEPELVSRGVAISYRPLKTSDLEALQEAHKALFPIEYELDFFNKAVHGLDRIFSWVAIANDDNRDELGGSTVVGFVTARMNTWAETDESDKDLLGHEYFGSAADGERQLAYILTLGVIKPYQGRGIATSLVEKVVQHASTSPLCRAVYLHVITYNTAAIEFYMRNRFTCVKRLSNFYVLAEDKAPIKGQVFYDSYLYTYYVNGGRPPVTPLGVLTSGCKP